MVYKVDKTIFILYAIKIPLLELCQDLLLR